MMHRRSRPKSPKRADNFGFYRQVYVIANKGVKQEDLRLCFEQYGTVKEIRAKEGGHNINFAKCSEACLAVEEMNGRLLSGYPKPLKVLLSIPKYELGSNPKKDQSQLIRKLQVVVPKGHTYRETHDYFKQFGDLEYVSVLRDRFYEGRQLAIVCFYRQYHAALAVEQCDRGVYMPKFITPAAEEASQRARTNDPWPIPNTGAIHQVQAGHQSMSLLGDGPAMGKRMPGDELWTYPNEGLCSLEIYIPATVSEIQVQRLCAMVPNLMACRMGEVPGKMYAHYEFPQCAAFALDRLCHFEFGVGHKLHVKYCAQDKHNKPHGMRDTDGLLDSGDTRSPWANRKEAVSMAADLLTSMNMREASPSKNHMMPLGFEMTPYCNVPVPRSKFDRNKGAVVKGKVWFVTSNHQVSMGAIMELALRFGEVATAYYVKEHLYGFIHLIDKSAAQRFVETLNNSYLCGTPMKCEIAQEGPDDKKEKKVATNGTENPAVMAAAAAAAAATGGSGI